MNGMQIILKEIGCFLPLNKQHRANRKSRDSQVDRFLHKHGHILFEITPTKSEISDKLEVFMMRIKDLLKT